MTVKGMIDHAPAMTTRQKPRWIWRGAVAAVAGLVFWTALQLVYGFVEFNERRAAVQEQRRNRRLQRARASGRQLDEPRRRPCASRHH